MTSTKPEAPAPSVELDAEGKALQLAAEKAKLVESIAKARSGTAEVRSGLITSIAPAIDEAPKGQVTFGSNAGSFGPWAAHRLLDALASKITTAAQLTKQSRVLVVGDHELQPGDWTAQEVGNVLGRLNAMVESTALALQAASVAFKAAVLTLTQDPGGPDNPGSHQTPPSTRGAISKTGTDDASPAPASPSPGGGAFTAAVNLMGLLRTDYTVTSVPTASAATELATLVAGKLAASAVVEADSFTTLSPPPEAPTGSNGKHPEQPPGHTGVRGSVSHLQHERAALLDLVTGLQADIAPLESGVAELKGRIRSLEAVWSSAVTDGKDTGVLSPLQNQIAVLQSRFGARERAVAPVRVHVARAQQVVAEVDAALAPLMQPTAAGEEPAFLTAARLEVLHGKINDRQISHVLYVNLDSLGSDAVTRRSVLGTSGQIQFLVGSTASWLLLNTSGGHIEGGGQVSMADAMSFDLSTGSTRGLNEEQWKALNTRSTVGTALAAPGSLWSTTKLATDPLAATEKWAKLLVSVLVVAMLLIGAFSFVAVLLSVVK